MLPDDNPPLCGASAAHTEFQEIGFSAVCRDAKTEPLQVLVADEQISAYPGMRFVDHPLPDPSCAAWHDCFLPVCRHEVGTVAVAAGICQ